MGEAGRKRGRSNTAGAATGGGRGSGGAHDAQRQLLLVHESAIEKLKASNNLILYVPKEINDEVEKVAKDWKDKRKEGEEHPDKCSCTTARFRALLSGVQKLLISGGLVLEGSLKTKLAELENEVKAPGSAHGVVADVSLLKTAKRDAADCPYQLELTMSVSGIALREVLFAVSQPGAAVSNAKDTAKVWEVRAYRPRRGGALTKQLR